MVLFPENLKPSPGTPLEDVPDIPAGEPYAQEWQTFKREVGRLIRGGHTGRFTLMKRDQVLGIWDTLSEADLAARAQFPGEPILVQEIQPFLRRILSRRF